MSSINFLNPNFNINFDDLYSIEGVEKIHKIFLDFLQKKHLDLYENYTHINAKNSDFLIDLAKVLELFIVEIFLLQNQDQALKIRDKNFYDISIVKREFIQRYILKKYSADSVIIDKNYYYKETLNQLNINISSVENIELELTRLITQKLNLEIIEQYCIWALFTKDGKAFHKDGTLFIMPKKIDKNNLIQDIDLKNRHGFDLTDKGFSSIRVSGEVHYCLYCHRQNKDSCKKGLIDKNTKKFTIDELDNELSGCPLEQKISEMNLLKSQGWTIGSLAMAVLDNPMIAGTGHRICNDCMQACIFQKQEPVDIPQIETAILKDVLKFDYGFEIYSLLSRWNPLNIISPTCKKLTGKKILICGLGPAGYTLSHYLLNEGHEIVAIDGLKIEPLDHNISGVDIHHKRHDFIPIKNINDIFEPLSSRIIGGFGGVAEYGITSRFEKNYLKIIRLLLQRRSNFNMYGGIRFGSSITDKIAFEIYGFDHVALAVGAGKPAFLNIENNFAKGVRLASDFLMALQLLGAYQQQLFTNLQIRTPIIVVGGGLTATDTATEAQAYYKVQIEKFALKIQKFKDLNIFDEFYAELNEEEKIIANEYLQDWKNPDAILKTKILYRKKIQQAPAYKQNHLELKNALAEQVEFVENTEIASIIVDKFKHICAIKTLDNKYYECKTLLMAIGTSPNISFITEDGLPFLHDNKYLLEHNKDSLKKYKVLEDIDYNFITKFDENNYKSISYFGDMHKNFEGSVVKAMASAKKGYKQISDLLKLIPNIDNSLKNYRNYQDDFKVNISSINRLSDNVVEVVVKSHLLANQTQIGQIFRLHNYHQLAIKSGDQIMAMEGVVVTALAIDKENGTISGIVVETGGSASLIKNFKIGEPCIFMGPSGKPTEIPKNEKVMLVGGGRGNQPLTALAKIFKDNGCHIIFFAGYKKHEYIVNEDLIIKNSHRAIIAIEEHKSGDYFHGNVIDAIIDYFNNENALDIDRIFVIGNNRLMDKVALLRHKNLILQLASAKYAITSLNSPMQCMLKGVCGQCLQKKHKKNGEVQYFYACANQDQSSDEIDFEHLHNRCEQNSLLEKTTKTWIKNL
jgi:NADPH-dependent glutamate synthase beta subunit-like oxidoreductase/NAD(P)H-flavin reductase